MALVAACGGEPRGDAPTWAYVHAAVIAPGCASVGCHSPLQGAASLDLSDRDASLAALLERRYVVPGDPNSPLMYQLEGRQVRPMPPNGPLPSAEVELVRRWIVEGAAP